MAKKKLSAILEEAGIYDPKLEPQIRLTERLEKLVITLTKQLKDADITDAKGNVTPLVDKVLNVEKQLQSAYASLGLNYSVKPDNYKQAKADEEPSDELNDILTM